ncbi:hypothetical protein DPMN_030532 [Dreissena polymorpha]|uniref:Uncharacterized protein n=1 Tax=Dreissena polymorpha TaxID=45954 RepID=A0A9D4RG92_DREPO|nr:hypothetical protein DPMN_030532 [Dreissena polymorpha]
MQDFQNCRNENVIGTNFLTKFHEDRKINVASRVLTRKNAPPPGSHVFQPTGIISELVQDIIGMNLLSKFHEDRTVNVASRVLTRFYYSHIRKIAPPLESHTNLLTKFHEDWTINVASRVLTRKNAPPPDIIGTNLLTKFYDDRKINVTSRVLTRFYYSHIKKNAPPLWWPYIIGLNLLTEFHEDRTINVASRAFTRFYYSHMSHVFQSNVTIFELIQNINKKNLLTKFHEDWTINVASRVLTWKIAPPPGGHVFQPTSIIVLTRKKCPAPVFHEDQTINVASGVKNGPPLSSHVFQAKVTIFEIIQDIIETNLLTKFHEDWKIFI